MANRSPSICTRPGCGKLTNGTGKCSVHQAREPDKRPSASARGYGYQWQKARSLFLQAFPLCVIHQEQGRVVSATVVDHVTPHKGDEGLFWNRANWQSLCKPCHDRKTAKENGGFGNPIQTD